MLKDNYMGRSVPRPYPPKPPKTPLGGPKGGKKRGYRPLGGAISDLERSVASKVGDVMGAGRKLVSGAANTVVLGSEKLPDGRVATEIAPAPTRPNFSPSVKGKGRRTPPPGVRRPVDPGMLSNKFGLPRKYRTK